MADIGGKINSYARLLSKGLFYEYSPDIMRGFLAEALGLTRLKVSRVTQAVERNESFWDLIDDRQRRILKAQGARLGNLDWLTSEWVIDAIKGDHPAMASLFLGWKKARNWLDRQVERVKMEIKV